MDYNNLSLQQRIKKTDFFEKIYDDQFSKLNIKRFYLQSRTFFVEQDIDKDTIIKLLKSVMTAKKKNKQKNKIVRVDKAAFLSSKNI